MMINFAWIVSECLLLLWMQYSHASSHALLERSSSGKGVAPQTCGTDNTNFYCPYDTINSCKPRNQRCTGSNICNNPVTMMEEGCSETFNTGEYYVFLGHAYLGLSGSRKRKLFEHRFITFRGFTYEFGSSYGVQVLDITDPKYKYRNGEGLNSGGIETLGGSYCTWEDANLVVNMWKSASYNFIWRNCQHFAKAMSHILLHGPCNRPENAALRGKRQDNNVELSKYIDQQFRNCSLVCCYDDSESSAVMKHNSYSIKVVLSVAMTNVALLMFV